MALFNVRLAQKKETDLETLICWWILKAHWVLLSEGEKAVIHTSESIVAYAYVWKLV